MFNNVLMLVLLLGVQTHCADACQQNSDCPHETPYCDLPARKCVADVPVRNCANPLESNACGSGRYECHFSVFGGLFYHDACEAGCFCNGGSYRRVNRDGSIDCVDRTDCSSLTGHATCNAGGLFCLNDKLCYCAGGTPTCTDFSCGFEELKGCWVYRPYGGQFIAPCPKDEAVFDLDDARDFCYHHPTGRFCFANDDCKTCFCNTLQNTFGSCKDQPCPDLDVNKGKCVVEKNGKCAFASEVFNYRDH